MKVVLAIIFFNLSFSAVPGQPKMYDWLVIYYMPYDNNLSPLSYEIINQFKVNGLKGNVCVTLQTDFAGPGGMMRYVVNEKVDSSRISREDSGTTAGFDDYLSWVSSNFKARHHAIVLLNHGGLIDEYGLDEYPSTKWLSEDSVATAIRKFNSGIAKGKVDFLFEQVCARGTLENAYEFRDVSEFTMVSQSLVPAPNYYYGGLFRSLDRGEVVSAPQLADMIVEKDRGDMYYSYTLINNSKWSQWLNLFDKYTKSLKPAELELKVDSIKTVAYWHENYWDFVEALKTVRRKGEVPKEAIRLAEYTAGQLIQKLYVNTTDMRMHGYCGLSVLGPFKRERTISLSLFGQSAFNDWLGILQEVRKNRK